MKILLFAPSATNENPSMGSFITQRIFELQKLGHKVIVIQHGNLIINNPLASRKKGILRIIAIIYRFIQNIFIKNTLKVYKNDTDCYYYYDSIKFSSTNSFYRWYKKNHFDLIHAHFLWFAAYLPEFKQKYSIPYIVTVHGSDIHEITPYDKDLICKNINIMENANKVIFVSEYLLKHAIALGFNNKNSIIIHNGINPKIFFYDNAINKNKNEKILGFVGHPIFIKRVYILPLVLRLVKKVYPDTKLLIVGSEVNDLITYLRFQTWQLNLIDDIDFIGDVPPEKVAEYMRKMDVLLLPSHNEGYGCVVNEAQACGIGVIGSSNGGIPEAVGKYGICVPESENFISDFANAIIKWFQQKHDPETISNSVRNLTWENCVENEIKLYRSVLNEN